MGKLNTNPNVAYADSVYQKLIDAHAGLSDADSIALNARLILLLINHIGDREVVESAIELARLGGGD